MDKALIGTCKVSGLTGEPLEEEVRLSVGEPRRDLGAFANARRSRR